MEMLTVAKIRCDGGTQSRAFMDETAVSEYKQAMLTGAIFPPVIVFYDGTDYWMADGFHRTKAARDGGILELSADIRQGTRRDAVLHSVGANSISQVNRTNADKRRAVLMLLEDKEWKLWSDSEISRRTRVSDKTVATIRLELNPSLRNSEVTEPRTYTTKHGTVATMNTANIGKKDEETAAAPLLSPFQSSAQTPSPSEEESCEMSSQSDEGSKTPGALQGEISCSESPPLESQRNSTRNLNESVSGNLEGSGKPEIDAVHPLQTPLDLCSFMAHNQAELLDNSDLMDWVFEEAKRLAQ